MMRRLGLSLLFLSSSLYAADTTQTRTEQSVAVSPTQQGAKFWQLTSTDWQRYERLMQSPLTYDMQDDNPLEVLAVFARDDAERTRFAERLVEFDKARTDGILALDVAYRAAWQRLYPNLTPIGARLPERVALFVRSECDACFDALKAWRSKGVNVDVYLIGGDDAALQAWANAAGVRHGDVDAKRITLNHDTRGLWFSLAKGKAVPVAIAQQGEGGAWSVIALP
ncbi:TIGR03759 family integrating conjugative element protein [Vibrio jasicida]|uniref:TIGR03759 family integrating conjugative element protein n=1 Tax=Vibrio jasicida TaxID=766224 RepID=UPI000CE31FCB|nr:TIGR03759 family integrating conjugative element protein [Vibrio jasicida]